MATSWQLTSEQQRFTAEHTKPPVRLAQWRGDLFYRIEQTEHRQPVDFGAAAQPAPNKAVINAEGALKGHVLTDVGRLTLGEGLPTEPPPPRSETFGERKGAHLELALVFNAENHLEIEAVLKNTSPANIALDRLVLSASDLQLGASEGRLSFFKNGYQSWTETRSFAATDRQMVSFLSPMNVMQDNLRNLPSGKRGEFTSDMFAAWGNLDEKVFLLAGQARGFRQFVYIRGRFPAEKGMSNEMALVYDLGGKVLPAGAQLELDGVVLIVDSHANRLQDSYFDLIKVEGASDRDLPSGWCSWYYYFAKIREQDIEENLDAAAAQKVDWRYFVLDDGYPTAIGDWLSVNSRFPGGLQRVAEQIRSRGMIPGLWLAPFVAQRNSRLYQEHREWFIKDENGKPVSAGWNPGWGLGGVFYGLDTTHPEAQNFLRELITTIVHEFGYQYLKLDFTYGAALYGQACDPSLSPAERLELGHRIIRETAGEDVFILGCGCPLSPVRGLVDAMRIGPDVAPYWFAKYRYHLIRDPHALCTKFAIRSILNRCQMHRQLWINDPDCLLLRDTDTRLTPDERMSLANAMIITGGMVIVSDRLAKLAPETWERLGEIEDLVRECDRGRPWPLDIMEREIPELVYNSKGYLAVFNFEDRVVRKRIPFGVYLQDIAEETAQFQDVWSGDTFVISEGVLDMGEMRPHASRLLKIVLPSPRVSF